MSNLGFSKRLAVSLAAVIGVISGQSSRLSAEPARGGTTKTIMQGAASGSPGTSIEDMTAGLQALVRTDKREYRVGEPIFADFRVFNGGTKPVNVYAEFEREGFLVFFELVNVAENKIVYQSRPFRVTKVKPSDSLYLQLPPNSTIGHIYSIFLPGMPFPPGEYTLQAGYINTYQACLASMKFKEDDIAALGSRAFVRLWRGRLVSRPIKLTIKGKLPKKKRKKQKTSGGLFRRHTK